MIVSLLSMIKGFHIRGGAAQNQGRTYAMGQVQRNITRMVGWRTILRLETRIVLFIENDQAQVGQRSKESRTRPNDDVDQPGASTLASPR